MLSILIPTYNYNSFPLVEVLHKQLVAFKISFEIICIDDGSKSKLNIENQKINQLSLCSFELLEKNIGRSAIRNLLASKANYNWLLFLDADVLPKNNTFISKYLSCIKEGKKVFCGGVAYNRTPDNINLLRYKYGIKYEEIKINKRNRSPYKFFFTSNFLIPKEFFEQVQFEEILLKYGREDLLFSLDLQKRGYKVIQIENEIYHLGLDDDFTFVSKTKEAMENIIFLEKKGLLEKEHGSLLKIVSKVELIGLLKLVGNLYPFFERVAIKRKSIFYFNCLKISYLCRIKIVLNG